MRFDLKSWIAGYVLGRAGIPLPFAATPGAYLYNGWKLPPLPRWDRAVYPWALILIPDASVPNADYAALYALSSLPVVENGMLEFGGCLAMRAEAALDRENGCALDAQWTELMPTEATGVVMSYVRWSNADVCRGSGGKSSKRGT